MRRWAVDAKATVSTTERAAFCFNARCDARLLPAYMTYELVEAEQCRGGDQPSRYGFVIANERVLYTLAQD
jgi:hypothetical protein